MTEPPAKILLDTPAVTPELDFPGIADALAAVISGSEPRFAVGIFGGWGSGKTTLMHAIRARLAQPNVVTVEFNAWRYEREPLLLVPLLDTLRAALVDWTASRPGAAGGVWAVAARVGRVVRALASGLSGEVGLPGAAKVSYDLGAGLAALREETNPDQPQSLFVAAFRELADALRELTTSGVDRVVVFVDDLDRCLPDKALDVLESIKLFFDLPGFVFVVGLDEEAVDRAVRAKFRADAAALGPAGTSPGDDPPRLSMQVGREYVKKIFQVPYTLPAVVSANLDQLLAGMYAESDLPQHQRDDFATKVRPYLEHITKDGRVNPREVKRFLNAYTLQTLVRPDLDRDTVLALQVVTFRYEWEEALFDVIVADPQQFLDALRQFREGDRAAFEALAPHLVALPPGLGDYLRSPQAAPLAAADDLSRYVSSLQTTRPLPTWLAEGYATLGNLRRAARAVAAQPAIPEARGLAEQVDVVASRVERWPVRELTALTDVLREGQVIADGLRATSNENNVATLAGQLLLVIADAYRELRRLRDVSPLSPA